MRRWAMIALFALASRALGQVYGPPPPWEPPLVQPPVVMASEAGPMALNPIEVLAGATRIAQPPGLSPEESPRLSAAISVMLVLTVITLVPSIMLMTTCFVRIIIVLGLLKQALGTQTLPPPQVVLGLSLFMTALVMSPTIERINEEAIQPYRAGEITGYDDLWSRAQQPVRDFMFAQIEATGNWSSLYMVLEYTGVDTTEPERLTRADVRTTALIPAFMLSELKTAFLMGFRVYLPFLVIDMVISSILISMSMMMLPPVLVSLPFKLLLFVLVDGWQLVVGSLLQSFVSAGPAVAMFVDGVAMGFA